MHQSRKYKCRYQSLFQQSSKINNFVLKAHGIAAIFTARKESFSSGWPMQALFTYMSTFMDFLNPVYPVVFLKKARAFTPRALKSCFLSVQCFHPGQKL
jgi:hypothetical protein